MRSLGARCHLRTFLVLFVLALLLAAPACREAPKSFAVLHFNDLHGWAKEYQDQSGASSGGLARLAALATRLKSEHAANGEPAYLVCAGDTFTGTVFSALFQGAPEFQAYGLMGFSFMVPGNHDWDFGAPLLADRARAASYPILAANVEAEASSPAFFKPCETTRVGPYRVGWIGLITPDTPKMTAPGSTTGYRFTDPASALQAVFATPGAKEWDCVIVLSHCGIDVDRVLARRFPRIGLIVGGHDHTALHSPLIENGVSIVQAGDRCRFLGEVTVTLSRDARPRVTGTLHAVTSDLPEDASVKALLAPFFAKEELSISDKVGHLPAAMSGERELLRSREEPLGDFVADALRQATGKEAAFINAGSIRAGLPAGDITGRDLYGCLPFEDTIVEVTLTGSQIQSVLDRCASFPSDHPPGGFLQVSGITTVYTEGKATQITVGGSPLVPNREYRVACTNFLLHGGDGHVEFGQGKAPWNTGLSLREAVKSHLEDHALEFPGGEGRIRRVVPRHSKAA
jgi:5'-nucleotidase/UDP-sugar diphosphatase